MKLTNSNYFSRKANKEYFSVSQFKQFKKCEAMAMAELNGKFERRSTSALLVGSYVDAHFSNEETQFCNEHPEMFKKTGELKSEFVQANEIINRIEKDKTMLKMLSGDAQTIMTGKIDSVPFKIKMDSYHADKMIVDLKIMRDFEPVYVAEKGRMSFIEAWEYDLQGAVYQEIVYQNTGKRLPFYIVAATKEPVTDIGIWQVEQSELDACMEILKDKLPRLDAIKQRLIKPSRCEKCDYCKQTKKVTIKRSSEFYD